MESRGISASVEQHETKSGSKPHQPATNIAASEQIEEFRCPVTTSIMFEPVMIMGCGHLVEGKMASGLKKCPLCRGEEKDRGISLVAVPPMFTSILARTLAADPTLWQQVYLDENYLEEILSKKDGLKTPTGERFIKLLENNSEENLNEKALGATKSVIEILASYYVGRELLRKNEKIRGLTSAETKQLTVNSKTIADWLAMEKEEPAVSTATTGATATANPARLFASTIAPARPAQPPPADTAWQRAVYGNEAGVLEMIQANPRLVTEKATVIDYSEREVDNATPFQIALRAGDEVMAAKIKDIYLAANPDHGQTELDAQFNEVFPNGYAAHLQEQQAIAEQFERSYVNPLVEAITNASPADLLAALDKRATDSVLWRKLGEFKTAFTELSNREKVYNPSHFGPSR